MKKTLNTLFALLLSVGLHAQSFEWAKSVGGTGDLIGRSIAVDALGNVYTTGPFLETVDFDPGAGVMNLTSQGHDDIFVKKLDSLGNLVWVKSVGGTSFDGGYSIAVDAQGNVYTTGYFVGTVDFDPGAGTVNLTSQGGSDIFIQKLDALGDLVWAKSVGGTGNDNGRSIAVDAQGNVYTTGDFRGIVDFDPGAGTADLTSQGENDVFIQKLDALGDLIWAKSVGETSYDYGYSIAVDVLGNVYTTGYFSGTVDFDPGAGTVNLTSQGGIDIFIQKLDALGDLVWAKSVGGTGNDNGRSIAVDAQGNVYTTGDFRGTVDFDPGAGIVNLTSQGGSDIFIQKLDALGDLVWVKSMGGNSTDFGESIAVDSQGNVYTTGDFRGIVDFDPGAGTTNLTSQGEIDFFIQKLDALGNLVWAKSVGGTSNDGGNSIAVDAQGNVYTTGYFWGTVDFDPGAGTAYLTAQGYDFFVQKLSPCVANTGTDVITACNSYTWIDGNTYTANNNTATYTLTNAAGCDSVVTLNLTIVNSNTGTDVITACDTYTWIDGNTYTANNNTATHTLTNAAGCDSVVTLNLTINSVTDITTSLNGLTITATNANASYQWLDCDNDNAAIVGETNPTFTATANGNYAVQLTENGCVDTSACVAITTVGIEVNSFGQGFTVYPNPSSGPFSIDLGASHADVQLTITDISGKVIQLQQLTQVQIIQLSIENPVGVYFVSIQSGHQKAVVKLIKK